MPSKSPWKDRTELLKDISSFTGRNGGFFVQNSKRMSDLFEMSVYNDAVKFYRRKKYKITICNLMSDGTFKYKLSTAGLSDNFSYFKAERVVRNELKDSIEIHHNIKIQSAHDDHIYYNADVSVSSCDGVSTEKQTNNRRHSFIKNCDMITFFEVKNMNPFPEVLINFSGLVLEFKPEFITGKSISISKNKSHLTPALVFSGTGSQYAESLADKLSKRYGYNVIRGLYSNKGKIYSFKNLNTYDPS